jgi:hypothetical protein
LSQEKIVSQRTVFELLKELGGRARTGEISKLAFEKYPDLTLNQYVSDRLHKLANWGYVKKNPDGTWEIISKDGP